MDDRTSRRPTRRDVVSGTGKLAAASALAGIAVPLVHAGASNTIQLALVGAGGRGTGAALNALSAKGGPTKLVAMADVFADKLAQSYKSIKDSPAGGQVDVPEDRRFIGFDGYKKAMDCLKPGDVAIFATPPAFRWVHFTYAIQKGLNVFMEKPTTVDGPSTRRMLELSEQSVKKNLKVGVGLMCRHCNARRELFDRLKGGEIGDITLLRAYRMHGPVGSCFTGPKPEGISELLWQIRRFHSFLWASGGAFSDFMVHNIDECCWMKDAWPVKAQGLGGRHYRGDAIDQNFDAYSVEYTFADGAKMLVEGRCMTGCHQEFATYAHGTRGSARVSTNGHAPASCRIYKGQNMVESEATWKGLKDEPNPYQLEWDRLLQAIRDDKPHNEADRGARASLVTAMGRMACHTGRVITFEEALKHDHELGAGVDKLTMDSPSPLPALPNGKYPIPQPGVTTKREY